MNLYLDDDDKLNPDDELADKFPDGILSDEDEDTPPDDDDDPKDLFLGE